MDVIEQISNLAPALHAVNELIKKFIKVSHLCFNEKKELMYFFHNYGDMASLIAVTDGLQTDICSQVMEGAIRKILDETTIFINLYRENKNILKQIEVKTDYDNSLAQLNRKWEEADTYSQEVWHEFKTIDHRLDYMDSQDPEYDELRARCDELDNQQKAASIAAQKYRMDLEHERRKWCGLEDFSIRWLYAVVLQIHDMAEELLPANKEEVNQ